MHSLNSNLQDSDLKSKSVVDQNMKESALKDSPVSDVINHSVKNVKSAIIIKKKKLKCTNNSVQPKALVKRKAKLLYDNIISNLDSETMNLTSDDARKFLLSCRFCRKEFEILENFKEHDCNIKKIQSTVKTYGCKYCSLTFTQRNHLNRHVIGHKRNNCTVCNAQFAKRKALCKHLKSEHNITEPEKLYPCTFCNEEFSKKSYLAEHLKVHANGQHVCLKCGFMSECKLVYEDHVKEHIKDLKYECHLCQKKFVRRQQLIQHIAGHEKHACSVCNITFSTKKLLIKHMRSVHGAHITIVKKYACPICKRLFAHPKQLQLHQSMHTENGSAVRKVSVVKCSHCEKSFGNSRNLSRHMKSVRHLQRVNTCEGKVVKIEKPFQCTECSARFFRQSSLIRHSEQMHSVKMSFKCPHCDYSTKNMTNLKRHLESHTDIRRFVCEMCGLCFRALATLKEHHAFVHSENRSFTCDVCKKSFKNKSTLQRHMKVHSETRPFKCHCNKDYKRLSHLKRHMASCHHMPFKKNHVPNIYEAGKQDTSSNDDAALVESLEGERNQSSSNNFPPLSACSSIATRENSSKLKSKVFASDSQYVNVPLNTMSNLVDKSGPHSLPDSPYALNNCDPKCTLVNLFPTSSIKEPSTNLETHQPASSSMPLDDANPNLSPSHLCNFNLTSTTIEIDNVTAALQDSIIQRDVLSLTSCADGFNQAESTMQNQPLSIDTFANFSLHQSEPPTVMSPQQPDHRIISDHSSFSSFLLGTDMSSPTHMNDLNLLQVTPTKHFFGDSDDILSLSHYSTNSQFNGGNCPPEQLFNSVRDIELWDPTDNSSRLKLPGGEYIEGACANNNFSTQANNLQNLLFSSDSFYCSLDANTLNSDFDSLSNLC